MRRKDREIADFDEIIEVIKKCDVCRVAMQGEEYPYVVPLNFGMEVEGSQVTLYFHGALEGMKYELLARNGKVCFEMDCGHKLRTADTACGHSFTYRSVMGTGQVVPLASPEEKRTGLMAVMAHATGRDDWDFPDASLQKTAVYRLCVRTWSAKANLGG